MRNAERSVLSGHFWLTSLCFCLRLIHRKVFSDWIFLQSHFSFFQLFFRLPTYIVWATFLPSPENGKNRFRKYTKSLEKNLRWGFFVSFRLILNKLDDPCMFLCVNLTTKQNTSIFLDSHIGRKRGKIRIFVCKEK